MKFRIPLHLVLAEILGVELLEKLLDFFVPFFAAVRRDRLGLIEHGLLDEDRRRGAKGERDRIDTVYGMGYRYQPEEK